MEKADFFLNVGNIDTAIDIALQTLRSIGENYEDELLYNDDLYTSDYCEQAGDLLIKVIEHPIADANKSFHSTGRKSVGID